MRKLGLLTTLWTALLFFPLSIYALGLGEIEVSSFLNQPLKAEIEVISARAGEVDDLLVSLASRDAFRKAGLDRPANLSKLRFKVEKSEDGQSASILISTKTHVKEPFLNFLVEADWAKGRLLREFTVLLDPPQFAQQAEAAPLVTSDQPNTVQSESLVSEPIAEDTSPIAGTQQVEADPVSQPIALTSEPETADDDIPYVADNSFLEGEATADEFVVNKGDTLWEIASQFKDGEHSMGQIMLAMQLMSPDAFYQDNINNLKVGAVLRAPDLDALDRLSKQEAYAQVLEQNGLWDEYVARVSGSATDGSPVVAEGDETSEQEADGQLSLMAPGDGESTSASLQNDANSEDAGQIRKQLALAEENLEAARLENDDLQSRIGDLEKQLGKFEELQNLVQIEDDSLAQLQDNSAETEEEAVVATEESEVIVEDQPSEVMIEAADAMMSEQSDDEMTGEMTEESEQAVTEEVIEETGTDAGFGEDTQSTEMSEEMTSDEEIQQEVSIPAPVIVTDTPTIAMDVDDGILDMLPSLDDLIDDPIMLGGMGAILTLIIGFVFLKRKKSDSDDSGITLEDGEINFDEDATPIHVPTAEDAGQLIETAEADVLGDTGVMDTEQHMADTMAVESGDTDEEDEFSKTAVISADEMPVAEQSAQEEQDDVLNEVDVYLAYGLYDNAEELLKDSLQTSPDRSDYRAKLLDTYFATKNADGFVKEAEALKSLGSAADRYWDRVQIMGFELAPDNELFAGARDSDVSAADLEYAKPEAADFDIGAEEDITDFSNTDFNLNEEADNFDLAATQVVSELTDEVQDTGTFSPPGDDFSETQVIDDEVQLPDLSSEDETSLPAEAAAADLGDLPDEIGDFDLDIGELSVEESGSVDEANVDEDALSFDLPDDLDLSTKTDDSLIPLDPTVEAPSLDVVPDMVDDDIALDLEEAIEIDDDAIELSEVEVDLELDDDINETMVMDSAPVETQKAEVDEGTKHIEAALDMDMSDLGAADLHTGTFSPAESESAKDDDITEFSPAEVTGEFTAFDLESDDAVEEIDVAAGQDKTGTFAPGDFNDELDDVIASVTDTDDIGDLMLPDDVDEVTTKLDLAKAFIDMGDAEGAKSSLEEVMSEGTQEQKAEATGLLNKIN